MADEETPLEHVVDGAKTVLGCGLQTIGVLIGVVVLFGLIFGVGLWIFGFFT